MRTHDKYKFYFLFAACILCSLSSLAGTKLLKIKISGAGYSDEIAVRFMEGATSGFDGCCDAWKMFSGNSAVPNIFTRDAVGDELAINSLPPMSNSGNLDVEFFLRIGVAATYSIVATKIDSFSSFTLINLIDNVTGTSYDLRSMNPQAISLPVIALSDPSRFSVRVTPPSILPVQLIMFNGRAEKSDAIIEWVTASEENNESFSVEKAGMDLQFISVGNLPGAGNSSTEKRYQFVDHNESMSSSEVVYYRLKQTDNNGNHTYFGPIAVQLGSSAHEITVYPAVSDGTFFVSGDLKNAEAKIYSLTGQQVHSDLLQGSAVGESSRIVLPPSPNGIYLLKITMQGQESNFKIILDR